MKKYKILAGLAAICVAAASVSVVAGAVEPSYTVSADYKDTLYYNNLLSVELTGDGATDTVAIALSQLGYHEGNNEGDLDGQNGGGNKNFTEYNVLFGKLDNGEGNGVSYGYAWCAAFVNWCLRQARVDKDLTGGMYVSCHAWRTWFVNEGAKYGASYHARTDDYIPKKGDLIFYKSLTATHNRSSDHIGIVIACDGSTVYAIEGNADGKVGLHEYDLNNRYIVGYGSIAYKTAEVPKVNHYETENYLPGQYIAAKGTVSAYKGPNSASGKAASLQAGAVYRITAVQNKYGYITLEDGTGGWVSLKRFTPMTADPYYTVELVAGEQSVKAVVAEGTSWTVPEISLTGETGELLGWSAGDGTELITAGTVLTPTSDLRLEPVYPAPEETETESESESESVTETEQLTIQSPEQGSTTEPEVTDAPAKSEGCNGIIGAAAASIMLAACAAFVCEKKRD